MLDRSDLGICTKGSDIDSDQFVLGEALFGIAFSHYPAFRICLVRPNLYPHCPITTTELGIIQSSCPKQNPGLVLVNFLG